MKIHENDIKKNLFKNLGSSAHLWNHEDVSIFELKHLFSFSFKLCTPAFKNLNFKILPVKIWTELSKVGVRNYLNNQQNNQAAIWLSGWKHI